MQPNKIKKLTLRVNLALAASFYPLLTEAAPLDISQQPLAGVVLQYAPNLVLAISVEFPTAGPAYTTVGDHQGRAIHHNQHLNMLYRGYFDPEKCYTYDGKHFEPVAMSQTIAGREGMCPSMNHFSGSFMNFMTASALDVFRQTLTGGNRAYGGGVDHAAYQAGDTASATYVRRSQPGSYLSGTNFIPQHGTMKGRRINLEGATAPQINQLLPGHYASSALKDIVDGVSPESSSGLPYKREYRKFTITETDVKNINDSYFPGQFPSNFNALSRVGENDRFADHYLYFTNTKFGAYAYRRVITADGKKQYFALAPNMQYENIVVRVCKPGFLEENCVKYDNGNYKPEGLLQEYSRTGMRVATLGYLNVNEYANSPVLRSRMKSLNKTETVASITYGQEWDPDSGQFVVNPDTTDAAASGVQNSGVINYVNKFGDVSGYKVYDIGSELYYTALRYLRGGANGHFGNLNLSKQRAHYVRDALTNNMRDGFPAIYNWDDPILRGLGNTVAEAAKSPQAQCRTSSIIYIGDTNTHRDRSLPNFDSTGFDSDNFDDIQTKSYLQALMQEQGLGDSTWNRSRGADNSPSGMAGLAYWARVNDIRSDIPGVQSGNNFILDVVENGRYKGRSNTYWLAAKYGGFDLKKATDFTYGGASYKMPVARDAWTDDAPGTSSIPGFFGETNPYGDGQAPSEQQGIPRNFGVANNPDSMKKSLEKAFAAAGTFDKPSQSSIGLAVPAGEKVDLTAGALIISSTFDATKLTGDLILNRVRFSAGSLQSEEQWKSSTKLNNTYHNTGNTWMNRSVFTKDGSSIKSLQDVTLPGSHASALRRFVLGSKQDEGTLWRKRNSLMGTTVYGAPVSILKPSKAKPDGDNCTFNASVMGREVHYAVAANDGMFHIFDSDGDEKIAYMPSTVLPKLEASALPDATHTFLNDGSAVYADVCFDSEAKSVVLANTGRGGAAVYALDVTDLETVSANNVLWEFSSADDADIGLTVGKLSVSKNGAGKPIAIFSSGFNNASERGYVFVLDLTNRGAWVENVNYWKIALGSHSVQGVGEPFVFDKNRDGTADHIYVGDYSGKLWRVNHDADNNSWAVANSGAALFTPAAADAAPITGSPFVQNVRGKTYVTFGTGQYLNDDGVEESVQNYAYGLIDEGSPIAHGAILEQEVVQVATTFAPVNGENTRELWEISGNAFDDDTHKGWRLKLQKGQTIVARPNIRGGEVAEYVAVSRGSNAKDICAIAGSTSIISLSLRSGGNYPAPLFDTTGDGFVDGNDTLGGMVTIKGQISPNVASFEAIIDDKKTHMHYGNSDTGVVNIAGRVFNIGSVMLRINHREVPL